MCRRDNQSAIITLLTDFGLCDSYVAQMKASILCLFPKTTIVDITHMIPPQDVAAGAMTLRDAAPRFPPGTVHVAVVDPGVGTARRIVAAECNGQRFVAPDNGLLADLIQPSDACHAVVVENAHYFLHPVSNTFHGRDIMAPVAAQLAHGLDLLELGPVTKELVRLAPLAQAELHDLSACRILVVDHFGNLILSQVGDELHEASVKSVRTKVGGKAFSIRPVDCYGNARPGELVLLRGSSGRPEIAVVNGSAAERLAATAGQLLYLA